MELIEWMGWIESTEFVDLIGSSDWVECMDCIMDGNHWVDGVD